jgi:hypothetical protein
VLAAGEQESAIAQQWRMAKRKRLSIAPPSPPGFQEMELPVKKAEYIQSEGLSKQ